MKSSVLLGISLSGLLALGTSGKPALAMVLKGRAFDGELSSRQLLKAFQEQKSKTEGLKVPLADAELKIELVPLDDDAARASATGPRSWQAKTDSSGAFSVETSLSRIPERHAFVASASGPGGRQLYSRFFRAERGEEAVHLYPTTEAATDLEVRLTVVYDILSTGETRSLRVRVGLQLSNFGSEMYVGRQGASGRREIWRIPFPSGATLLENRPPHPDSPGWVPSSDGRWLIIDSPIPGLCDFEGQRKFWEAHFVVPARQAFVQQYPANLRLKGEQMSAWCIHEDMKLQSDWFHSPQPGSYQDPFTGEKRQFDVMILKQELAPGGKAPLVLTVDNAAVGQVSESAIKWVGGFILVLLLAILAGQALGRKGLSPEALLANLSGEEVLDRIAQLDAQFARGKLREADYQRYRELLLELAVEEKAVEGKAAAPQESPGRGPFLPPAARELLRRLDALERGGLSDPAKITERAHLLEALARALPRESLKE